MVLAPFKSKNKQRTLSSIVSLGGLLLVAVGLVSDLPKVFLGLNNITSIGIISFIIGLVYLIDLIE